MAARPAKRATVARRPEAAEHDRPYRAAPRGSRHPINNTDPSGFLAIAPGYPDGAVITGSVGGAAQAVGAAGVNIVTDLLSGLPGGGSAGSSYSVAPTTAPAGMGVSPGSSQAKGENQGRVGPGLAGGFDKVKKFVKAPSNWYWAKVGTQIGIRIGAHYQQFHPEAFNNRAFSTIVARSGGHISKVNRAERPDIFDPVTRALWEIKPAGSEALGANEANYYVGELGKAGVSAHPGSYVNLDEELGANGSIEYGIYHVDFTASANGVITYETSFRGDLLRLFTGAAAGAAAGAGAGSPLPFLVVPP